MFLKGSAAFTDTFTAPLKSAWNKVANNNQITEGILAAVYKGNQENNQLLREEIAVLRAQNQLLTELLNKEVGISYSDVGKASHKYAREYMNRTGKLAYI